MYKGKLGNSPWAKKAKKVLENNTFVRLRMSVDNDEVRR